MRSTLQFVAPPIRSRLVSIHVLACALAILAPSLVHADKLEPRPQTVVVRHHDPGGAPFIGPRHAPVTIDFFIRTDSRRNVEWYKLLMKLAERHPRRLRLVFRVLESSGSSALSEAVIEAHVQGRFPAFMTELSRYFRKRRRLPTRRRSELLKLCRRAGLDIRRLEEAWRDHRHLQAMELNELYRRRRRVPIRSLTLLINGVPSSLRHGETSLKHLEELYDEAYTEAMNKLAGGATLEQIYHLSLLEADAALEPIAINAGAVNGQTRRSKQTVLSDAPLIDPRARQGGYLLGSRDARVTIHLYCDFTPKVLPCIQTKAFIDEVLRYYPGIVRVFFHHMIPASLSEQKYEQTVLFHAAAVCADRQGVFREFYDSVYHPGRRNRRQTASRRLEKVLERLDIDMGAFTTCVNHPDTLKRVSSLVASARQAGIENSPTVIVGDRMYPGSKTLRELLHLVEIELMPGLLERLAPNPPGSEDWLDELIP